MPQVFIDILTAPDFWFGVVIGFIIVALSSWPRRR